MATTLILVAIVAALVYFYVPGVKPAVDKLFAGLFGQVR